MQPEILLNKIHKAIKEKNYLVAKKLLEKALETNKKSYELFYNLGMVYKNLNNYEEAIINFNKSIELNPNFSAPFTTLGIIYSELSNQKLALEHYMLALKIDPKNFIANYNLGNFYLKIGDLDNAEKYFNFSININPNNINPYNNLFQLYDRSNNIKKLEIILKKTKNIFGSNTWTNFFEGMVQYRKKNYQVSINLFEKLEIEKNDISKNVLKANILAKNYDHIGSYEKAYKYYTISNNILEQAYLKSTNKEIYKSLIKKRLDFFSNNNLIISNEIINKTKKKQPVFLVGFPRSGTTLLDTILRTHKSIKVLEEKPLVDKIINVINKYTNNDLSSLQNLNNDKISEIQKLYFQERDKYIKVTDHEIFIDKLPLNIIYVGEILKIFPDAKFIFALRHPYDAVLSCFMQPFLPNDAMSNFLNLKDTALFYDLTMQLWITYLKNFNLNFHLIKYENIVNKFDQSLKDLLIFLNLDWSNNLKRFYINAENKRFINTPSYNQVNRPIYRDSINRWKNYEKKFKEVKPFLSKWLDEFNY